MLRYLTKWILASLGFPLLVLFFGVTGIQMPTFLVNVTLLFWPSSIFLMALGEKESPLSQVLYIWSTSVVTNIAVYSVIGLAVYWFFFRVSESK
ncbi:MAG TPA: hypothetical protein ENI26_10585 [Methylophaga aminisulfidivorans]|uniref:Uncharacterized protein n=2 Tax=root TaxID=1 RepID=A0A7C1W8C1_9GAMM|nr:hypothetical protein [Methylophaga aminisulfidivorans]